MGLARPTGEYAEQMLDPSGWPAVDEDAYFERAQEYTRVLRQLTDVLETCRHQQSEIFDGGIWSGGAAGAANGELGTIVGELATLQSSLATVITWHRYVAGSIIQAKSDITDNVEGTQKYVDALESDSSLDAAERTAAINTVLSATYGANLSLVTNTADQILASKSWKPPDNALQDLLDQKTPPPISLPDKPSPVSPPVEEDRPRPSPAQPAPVNPAMPPPVSPGRPPQPTPGGPVTGVPPGATPGTPSSPGQQPAGPAPTPGAPGPTVPRGPTAPGGGAPGGAPAAPLAPAAPAAPLIPAASAPGAGGGGKGMAPASVAGPSSGARSEDSSTSVAPAGAAGMPAPPMAPGASGGGGGSRGGSGAASNAPVGQKQSGKTPGTRPAAATQSARRGPAAHSESHDQSPPADAPAMAPIPVSAARLERDAIADAATADAARRAGSDRLQLARRIAAALNVPRSGGAGDLGFFWVTAVTTDGEIVVANSYGLAYIPEGVQLPEQVHMATADEAIPASERARWATYPVMAVQGWAEHRDTKLRAVIATEQQLANSDPGAAKVLLEPDDIPESGDMVGRSRLEVVDPEAADRLAATPDPRLVNLLPPAPAGATSAAEDRPTSEVLDPEAAARLTASITAGNVDPNFSAQLSDQSARTEPPADRRPMLWFGVVKPMASKAAGREAAHLRAFHAYAAHAQEVLLNEAHTSVDLVAQRDAVADWLYWKHLTGLLDAALAGAP
ncbi:hypothetical protein [Mycobacterium sp. E796]|uniref:hypothetical protein n=1 Tax=Mycobacterium sp. E796 TaxID=1834151 RepID=UPI0007FBC127|nr:hypothetical protein [Mycobacterium sp. E796]OBI59755.1 hypothetical protein A5706_01330 [Mycobacterium sp. E796]